MIDNLKRSRISLRQKWERGIYCLFRIYLFGIIFAFWPSELKDLLKGETLPLFVAIPLGIIIVVAAAFVVPLWAWVVFYSDDPAAQQRKRLQPMVDDLA
jgi:hypothetical protein